MTIIFNPPHVNHIGPGWKTGPNKGSAGCYECGETSCRAHCQACGVALDNANYCPPCEDVYLSDKYPEVM